MCLRPHVDRQPPTNSHGNLQKATKQVAFLILFIYHYCFLSLLAVLLIYPVKAANQHQNQNQQNHWGAWSCLFLILLRLRCPALACFWPLWLSFTVATCLPTRPPLSGSWFSPWSLTVWLTGQPDRTTYSSFSHSFFPWGSLLPKGSFTRSKKSPRYFSHSCCFWYQSCPMFTTLTPLNLFSTTQKSDRHWSLFYFKKMCFWVAVWSAWLGGSIEQWLLPQAWRFFLDATLNVTLKVARRQSFIY